MSRAERRAMRRQSKAFRELSRPAPRVAPSAAHGYVVTFEGQRYRLDPAHADEPRAVTAADRGDLAGAVRALLPPFDAARFLATHPTPDAFTRFFAVILAGAAGNPDPAERR